MKQSDLMPLDLFRVKAQVDTLFRSDQFFRMELIILEKLDWDISIPTALEVASLLIRSHLTLSEQDSKMLVEQLRFFWDPSISPVMQSNPLTRGVLFAGFLVEKSYGETANSSFLTWVAS